MRKVYLIVLDSVGIGAAPDAAAYGDAGASTLAHTAAACGGLHLPVMQALGLGCIPPLTDGLAIAGVPAVPAPTAAYGAMREQSAGKDTTTGHWEMAGLYLEHPLRQFPPGPPSFPDELINGFSRQTGRGVIGNRAASGTAIIRELGEIHMRTGDWIVYTSADSVVQIAAHEDIVPLDALYAACRWMREQVNPLNVGRVIARPFTGSPGTFTRTDHRRDFSLPLPEPSVLARLAENGSEVIAVGKLDDLFPGDGITEAIHLENNPEAIEAVMALASRPPGPLGTLVFANLIDFDMRYGHRRDPLGYGAALEDADRFIGDLQSALGRDDILMITADHGNDPTVAGSDHTREYVPLLVYGTGISPTCLGVRQGFYDVAQTLAFLFHTAPMPRGRTLFG